METNQVQQLKLNVTNISSFLKKSNKKYIDLKKSNKAIVAQEVKKTKVKTKESKVEQRISPKTSPLAAVKKIASPGMSLFDRIVNFGSILATGVLINAIPGFKKKIDEFKKDNKEVIDNVVSTLTIVKNFGEDVANWLTEPEADHGFLSSIAEFDPHTGRITGGALKTVEDTFDGFGVLINKIDKAIGGKGTAGNAFLRDRSDEIAGINVSKSNLKAQTETKSGMATFREDSAQNAALQEKVKERMQREKEQARNPGAAESSGSSGKYGSLLDFIGSGEGGYNSMNQGTQGNSIVGSTNNASSKLGKNLTDMTIGEIMDRQAYLMNRSNPQISDYGIFAAGKYQIIPGTMPGAVAGAGLSRSDKFTPQNQDKLGMALIMNKRPYVGKYLRGEHNDVQGAMLELAREFASMPDPNTGRSLYGSGNRAFHSVDEVREALIKARNKPQPKITPVPNNKGDQAKALNTTVGEEGSTTFVLMRQQVIT